MEKPPRHSSMQSCGRHALDNAGEFYHCARCQKDWPVPPGPPSDDGTCDVCHEPVGDGQFQVLNKQYSEEIAGFLYCDKIGTDGYRDMIRLGKLRANGSLLEWEVQGHTQRDLKSFCNVLLNYLGSLAKSWGLDMERLVMEKTVYWICKCLDYNYVLGEVHRVIRSVTTKRILGVDKDAWLNIKTESCGMVVEYFVDIRPSFASMKMGVRWPWRDNIVEFTEDCEQVPHGTLSSVETEFRFPPQRGFIPDYDMYIDWANDLQMGKGRKRLRIEEAVRATPASSMIVSSEGPPLGPVSSSDSSGSSLGRVRVSISGKNIQYQVQPSSPASPSWSLEITDRPNYSNHLLSGAGRGDSRPRCCSIGLLVSTGICSVILGIVIGWLVLRGKWS